MQERSNLEVTALKIIFGISIITTLPTFYAFIVNRSPFLLFAVVFCFNAFNIIGLWALYRPKPNPTIIGLSVGLSVQLLLFVIYYFQIITTPPFPFLYAGMYAVLMALVMTNRIAIFVLWATFAYAAFLIYGETPDPEKAKNFGENQVVLAHLSVHIFAVLIIAAVALRSRVRHYEEKLREANKQLEHRVEERTAELQSALNDRTQALHDLASSKDQLILAQKTESIGRLSGGIAHDFNNLLTVILSATYSLRNEMSDDDSKLEDVEAISDAGERAAALTDQLLAFSRQDVVIPKPISLNDACISCIEMVRRMLGEHVQIELKLQADRDTIFIGPSQLDQILINLSINARDAMPGGGVLIVRTKNIGDQVQLQIEDNGYGIPNELQSQIFDPFVTNKPKGIGTGLGLSIVAQIIETSGGKISVQSNSGRGTTFNMHWPIVEADHLQPMRHTETNVSVDDKTILVVDDDVAVLKAIKRTLESLGYNVLTADKPAVGLKFADHQGQIDLLLADLVMPKIDGLSFLREFVSRRPVPVLLMTGHVPDKSIRATLVDKNVRMLNKPFRPDQLATQVKEAIAKPISVDYAQTNSKTTNQVSEDIVA